MSFGVLNHAELRCCGEQMRLAVTTPAYVCPVCGWGVTRIEFLRSAHLPSVTAAVAAREIGRQM